MLPKAEIIKLKNKSHTSKFTSTMDYPMVLWITMLYDDQSGLIRWLSY
jgi:serine/threonine-protein kinase